MVRCQLLCILWTSLTVPLRETHITDFILDKILKYSQQNYRRKSRCHVMHKIFADPPAAMLALLASATSASYIAPWNTWSQQPHPIRAAVQRILPHAESKIRFRFRTFHIWCWRLSVTLTRKTKVVFNYAVWCRCCILDLVLSISLRTFCFRLEGPHRHANQFRIRRTFQTVQSAHGRLPSGFVQSLATALQTPVHCPRLSHPWLLSTSLQGGHEWQAVCLAGSGPSALHWWGAIASSYCEPFFLFLLFPSLGYWEPSLLIDAWSLHCRRDETFTHCNKETRLHQDSRMNHVSEWLQFQAKQHYIPCSERTSAEFCEKKSMNEDLSPYILLDGALKA